MLEWNDERELVRGPGYVLCGFSNLKCQQHFFTCGYAKHPLVVVGLCMQMVNTGAFHYAKDSGNFGRNSNGKVRFGFF